MDSLVLTAIISGAITVILVNILVANYLQRKREEKENSDDVEESN